MPDPAPYASDDPAADDPAADTVAAAPDDLALPPLDDEETAAAMQELRRLLLAPEQTYLSDVKQKLEALENFEVQIQQVSEVLPDAVIQRMREDGRLSRALAPTIEETLKFAIRRNPKPMADALFPIIGPAIRKSIAEALRGLMETINRTVEKSLSVESFKWRFEALRTGRSFGEVMLSHTLLYRVEQLFFIDRRSGLPIQHAVAEAIEAQDSALVSGMLTAIQDFVQDSFGAADDEVLDAMQMGDLTVWIEEGPDALVAAVIRGIPPGELRTRLHELIETFHLEFGPELGRFEGDTEPFANAQSLLRDGLVTEFKNQGSSDDRQKMLAWLIPGVLVVALIVWQFFAWRSEQRFNALLDAFHATPGLVVTEAGQRDGQWFIEGLQDPLAASPDNLLAASPLEADDVVQRWRPFYALDPPILERRAVQLLEPPPSVTLQVVAGQMVARGTAPPDWIAIARERSRGLPVGYVDTELTADFSPQAARVGQHILRFRPGGTRPAPGQNAAFDALALDVREAFAAAGALGQTLLLEIHGHASAEGPPAVNQRISQQRAEAIRQALLDRGLPADRVVAVGTGQPRTAAATPEARAENRSVSFHLKQQ